MLVKGAPEGSMDVINHPCSNTMEYLLVNLFLLVFSCNDPISWLLLELHWSKLQWRHNGRDVVLNHRRLYCLPTCLFRRRSKKASKFRVTGLCDGNSPVTGEFTAQTASNAGNVSICWRHHDYCWVLSVNDQISDINDYSISYSVDRIFAESV